MFFSFQYQNLERNDLDEKMLNQAVKEGDVPKVKELIKTTYVDAKDSSNDFTPLILAGKFSPTIHFLTAMQLLSNMIWHS